MHGSLALVTGGSRGIGRAVALQLARDGHHVIVNYRSNEAAAADTVAAIVADGGGGDAVRFDISDRERTASEIKRVAKQIGKIEILVNNAGAVRDQPLVRMKHEDWDAVIGTNLTGTYHCTRAVLKTWAGSQRGSRIINVTSVLGETGVPYVTNYAASKAGLIGFTKSLASELGPKNITVNAVSPGLITTDSTVHLDEDEYVRRIPLHRPGRPEEVAHLISFLASSKADYITGQVIRVNGGLYT